MDVVQGKRASRPAWVAIPAKNEADEIGACLASLAAQAGATLDGAVLCLNNCSDGSADLVRGFAPSLPFPVEILDVALPPDRACAGWARRMAMTDAAARAGHAGVVLTTDADGRAGPHWLATNLAAIEAGADAVAGRATIDPAGAALIPPHLHEIDRAECAYAALLDEIRSLIDPDPADPWPRHDEHSGASIAVTVPCYHQAGGMPPARLAEDRQFFAALRRIDARIRHNPATEVVVSARTIGRAAGGMADTIRRRIEHMDAFLDDRLEPAADACRRARLRARLGKLWRGDTADNRLADLLGVPIDAVITERYFGSAWAKAEQLSPVLQRCRPVALVDLPREANWAIRVRDYLRRNTRLTRVADRDDSALREAAE